LLYKVQSVFGCFILAANDINVEVVLIKAVKDDLDIAYLSLASVYLAGDLKLTLTHDFVDFAVLLTADKLLVFVCELYLHADLVGVPFDERDLTDNHHGVFDGVIGAIDGERELFKAQISS